VLLKKGYGKEADWLAERDALILDINANAFYSLQVVLGGYFV
jgi:hypothetical protein